MTVGRICTREVDLVEPGESVQAAAQRMLQRNVGTLVALDDEKSPIGILTDRDLVLKVLARGLSAEQTLVGAVMTEYPRTIEEDAPIESALSMMRAGSFRRLPVVDSNRVLTGLVSLHDILALLSEEASMIGKLLEQESPHSLGKA